MIRQSYQRAPRQDRAPVSRSLAGQRFGPANRNPIITRDQPASARTHMPVSRMRASCAFVIDRGLRREPCRKKTVRALISAERAGNVAGATVRCGGQALRRPRSPCPPPAPRTASIKLDAGLASGSGIRGGDQAAPSGVGRDHGDAWLVVEIGNGSGCEKR